MTVTAVAPAISIRNAAGFADIGLDSQMGTIR